MSNGMRILTGNANPALARAICEYLKVDLGRCEVGRFPDGETKVRILDDVRGSDVFVVQPTCPPANEHLMELLIVVDAARRASARRVTAVVPYYGYARQDRKHQGRVPITAKLVANQLATAGCDRVLCMDLHATQIQGFFDIPMDHLYAAPVLMEHVHKRGFERPVIMSPDIGSLKMADAIAQRLNGELAVVEKRRVSDVDIQTGHVIGDVKNRPVVIVDDMIASAGSMAGAIRVARENGASDVLALATHGLFVGPAFERLREAGPDEVIVTDTVPQRPDVAEDIPLTVLSVADLLGEAISRIHRGKSVSLLFV